MVIVAPLALSTTFSFPPAIGTVCVALAPLAWQWTLTDNSQICAVLLQLDSFGVRMDDTPFEMPQMFLCVYTVVGRQQNRPVILDLLKDVSLFWASTGSELDDKVADIMLL